MIETERLILRPFRDADREAFAAINADPRVGDWLGGPIDRATSDAFIDRVTTDIAEHGFGFWAAEQKADGRLVGAIGILIMGEGKPALGAIELGWRLAADVHGQGLATEGARAVKDWAFANIDTDEVVAITAVTNLRSQAVMRKIGMTADPAREFDHPKLPGGHPLRRHVFFAASRAPGST